MIYLLDVNILIAAIWQDHEDQPKVEACLCGKRTATCPLSELGFCELAAATHFHFEPSRNHAGPRSRNLFGNLAAGLIPDDFSPRTVAAQSSRQFTDLYLAELAQKHRMKLATLDMHISHRAVELVS
jgi:predicted nucleic acid-binding protein